MSTHFTKTKKFLQELNYNIIKEIEVDGIFVIEKENLGVKNLIIGVAYPILIMEQFIFKVSQPSEAMFKELLKKNRDIIHGAFVLDETGQRVIFRDTLLLSEYTEEIIQYSKY